MASNLWVFPLANKSMICFITLINSDGSLVRKIQRIVEHAEQHFHVKKTNIILTGLVFPQKRT